jgi:hypothetical protein
MIFQRKIEYKETIESLIAHNDYLIKNVIRCLVETKKAKYNEGKGIVSKTKGISPDLFLMKYRVELHWLYETRKILFTQYLKRTPTRKEMRRKFITKENNPFDQFAVHEKFKSLKFNIKL